jgi:hypothetical protein
MISSFLIELKDSISEHMTALAAISYPACWPTYHAMMRLVSKELMYRAYNPDVVLMTKHQGKQLHLLLRWQSHCCAGPVSWIPRKRHLFTEIVNKMAFCVSIETIKQERYLFKKDHNN